MDQSKFLKIALLIGGSAILLLLALMITLHLGPVGNSLAPPSPAQPTIEPSANTPTDPSLPSNPLADHLTIAYDQMAKARKSLANATIADHGGYVEKAKADVEQAMADFADALTYAREHADPATLSTPPISSADALAAAAHAKNLTIPKPNQQPSMVNALNALQASLEALQNTPGGDLGGLRNNLLLGIDHAATNITDAFTFKRNHGKSPPAPPAPSAPPGTAPTNADPALP